MGALSCNFAWPPVEWTSHRKRLAIERTINILQEKQLFTEIQQKFAFVRNNRTDAARVSGSGNGNCSHGPKSPLAATPKSRYRRKCYHWSILGVYALVLTLLHQNALRDTQADLHRQSLALSELAERTLQSVDLVLESVVNESSPKPQAAI